MSKRIRRRMRVIFSRGPILMRILMKFESGWKGKWKAWNWIVISISHLPSWSLNHLKETIFNQAVIIMSSVEAEVKDRWKVAPCFKALHYWLVDKFVIKKTISHLMPSLIEIRNNSRIWTICKNTKRSRGGENYYMVSKTSRSSSVSLLNPLKCFTKIFALRMKKRSWLKRWRKSKERLNS